MSEDAADILAVEARRYEAMRAGDADALDELLHEDLRYVHSSGLSDTKASYLDSVRQRKWTYQSIEARDQSVRIYGDLALLTSRILMTVVIDDAPARFEVVMVTALSRNAGKWQVVHAQGTRAAG